jgi:alpha-amylase
VRELDWQVIMKLITTTTFALSALLLHWPVAALTAEQWKTQSIYQVVTDRFARTDGSTTATCNTGDQIYCGGTWQGIINHLDYIQNMGFTAVSLTLNGKNTRLIKCYSYGYLP